LWLKLHPEGVLGKEGDGEKKREVNIRIPKLIVPGSNGDRKGTGAQG